MDIATIIESIAVLQVLQNKNNSSFIQEEIDKCIRSLQYMLDTRK